MTSFFDEAKGIDDIGEIFRRMTNNYPEPSTDSEKLWKLRRSTGIARHNQSKETMLEKAVAQLADNGHMPGWFNQCPVASGIGDSSRYRHSNIDLVHWSEPDAHACLVELKWASDTPTEAIQQILRYGAAYAYCRIHRDRLHVQSRPVMDACNVSLLVAAPACYYTDSAVRDCLFRARECLKQFNNNAILEGVSMTIDALAFPDWFDSLPFCNGAEVCESCNQNNLTDTGKQICDAFDGLLSVFPEQNGGKT